MTVFGYVRVSTSDQKIDLQKDAIIEAGVDDENIFSDIGMSGSTTSRPGLDSLLSVIQTGDTLIVWRLDRLGRDMTHIIALCADLDKREIKIRSLVDGVDTSTSTGRLMIGLLSALAEHERTLIRERVNAGIAAARARGVVGGRRRALTPSQARHAADLLKGGKTLREVANLLNTSHTSVKRAVDRLDQQSSS